ncbi:MAG: TonB-dependent receptor [Acidobacteria bacterium]|nr:TonB-dependent receptor [Acidobacteriota bacterium]
MKQILLVLALALAHFTASAQVTGRISGSVSDSSGAAIPNAQVELFLPGGKSPVLTTATSSGGLFFFAGVRAEFYDLAVSVPGFRKEVIKRLKVDAATELSLPAIKLEVSSVSESVEVSAETSSVQTASVEVATNITNAQIARLPQLNRSPLALISTQAGVGSNGRTNTTINGLRTSFTNVSIDGINIQDNFIRTNALDFLPNLLLMDQVAEFTISTSNTNVSLGNGSAQVNFVTPSGSNNFHGGVNWLNRNNAFRANSWFNNRNGVALPFLNQNQFGGKIGGRIIRDKLFFYSNFEAFRLHQQATATRTIFTASARQGIFTYRDTAGNLQQRNVLQTASQQADSRMQQILAQIPGPENINRTDVGDGLNTAGYSFNLRNNRIRNNFTGKLDWVASTKHVFSATYLFNTDQLDRPDLANDYSKAPKVSNDNDTKLLSLTYRWSPTPSMTNELRGGYNIAPGVFLSSENFGTSIINTPLVNNPVNTALLPQGRYTDTYNLQDNFSYVRGKHTLVFGFQSQYIRVESFNDAGIYPTYNMGISTANTFGLTTALLPGVRAADLGIANALLSFHAGFITSSGQTFNATSRTSGFVGAASNRRNFTLNNHAWYAGDKWKIRPRVTLNLGVRWEYFSPVDEAKGLSLLPQLINNNPIETLLSRNGTLDFAGSAVGRPWYNKDLNNYAPNVGIAWDVKGDGMTSIRAGYSINYANDEFIRSLDNNAATNAGLSQGVTQSNLVARAASVPAVPTPAFKVPRTFADNYAVNTQAALGLPEPNLRSPYVQQWNLSVQRFVKGGVLEARYIGHHDVKAFRAFDYNQVLITPGGFLQDFIRAQNNGNLARVATGAFSPVYNPAIPGSQPLPTFSQMPNALLTNPTISNLIQTGQVGELANTYQVNRLQAPFNFYTNPNALGTNLVSNYSNSTYHGLQIDYNKRFSKGLQLNANYTWSKVISDAAGDGQTRFEPFLDFNNGGIERSRTPFDLPHAFKSSGAYELPFGHGKKWASSSGVVNRIIGGWMTSGILTLQSGSPFGVASARGTLNRAGRSGENTAITLGDRSALDQVVAFRQTPNGPYFVSASAIGVDGRGVAPDGTAPFSGQTFYNPGPGQIGTLQRRYFTGPRFYNLDLSIRKLTRIKEGHSLEFTADFFNLTNSVSFFLGDQNINATTFGRITATNSASRIIQFALKYDF